MRRGPRRIAPGPFALAQPVFDRGPRQVYTRTAAHDAPPNVPQEPGVVVTYLRDQRHLGTPEAKRLCKKFDIRVKGIRTWRFRPVWGLDVSEA